MMDNIPMGKVSITKREDGTGYDAVVRSADGTTEVKNVIPFGSREEAKSWGEERLRKLQRGEEE